MAKKTRCEECGHKTGPNCQVCEQGLDIPTFMELVEIKVAGSRPDITRILMLPGYRKIEEPTTQADRFDAIIRKKGGIHHDTFSSRALRYQVNTEAQGGKNSPQYVGQLLLRDVLRGYKSDVSPTLSVIAPVESKDSFYRFEYRIRFFDDSYYLGEGFLDFDEQEGKEVIRFLALHRGKAVEGEPRDLGKKQHY